MVVLVVVDNYGAGKVVLWIGPKGPKTNSFRAIPELLQSLCKRKCASSVPNLGDDPPDNRHSCPDPPRRCSMHLFPMPEDLGQEKHTMEVCCSFFLQISRSGACAKLCKSDRTWRGEGTTRCQ